MNPSLLDLLHSSINRNAIVDNHYAGYLKPTVSPSSHKSTSNKPVTFFGKIW